MGRLVLAGVLLTSMVGGARAAHARKVKVESTPPGGTVYIASFDNGAACDATPCTIDVPVGTPTLIVQLAKYQPEFKQLDVAAGRKPMNVSVTLKESTGYIVIDSPKGASVKINDEDEGKVPVRVKVAAEPVRVVVKQDGKTLFDDFVEVEPGGEHEVDVKSGGPAVAGGGEEGGEEGGDGGEEGGEGSGGGVDDGTTVAPAPRAAYLNAGLAFDIGFRKFALSDGTLPFSNAGEVLVGPAVELWPGRMAGMQLLRGLSLFARLQFAVVHQKVTRDNMGTPEDVGAETFWGAFEVSLRHKWVFGDLVGVEANAGFIRDQVAFNAINQTTLAMVPSADYRSIRIGARVSLARPIEPYVSVENRVVLSGGELEKRADNAEVSGYALAGGVNAAFGPVAVRAEASVTKYNWKYSSNSATPPIASGADDRLIAIKFLVGYQY